MFKIKVGKEKNIETDFMEAPCSLYESDSNLFNIFLYSKKTSVNSLTTP